MLCNRLLCRKANFFGLPLRFASRYCDYGYAPIHHADVNLNYGFTPIRFIRYLWARKYYALPLRVAVEGGNEAIVRLLLEYGADANAAYTDFG